jgi:L-alanine-DL-glutamate epimerase-like enolase superfamily enzyme
MDLIIRVYELPLKHRFTISRQSFDTKRTLIVELKDGEFSGYGEASENPYYHKTIEDMVEDLMNCRETIENAGRESPEDFWSKMQVPLRDNMFALCALDIAYNDLNARRKGKKLYELWNLDIRNNPLSNYTLGIDTIERMVSKMHEKPWPVYKIKLGTDQDLEIVRALRSQTDSVFRIDANCAWDAETALENAQELAKLGVEFIEQPLPREDVEGNLFLFKKSPLPIIADESCQVEEDVLRCHSQFHGVNIKLVKCGGLTPARRMLKQAHTLGMKKMVGCMTESSVGISAIAHLLPLLDYVDMDGATLLAEDIAEGVTLRNGMAVYSGLSGTGVRLTREPDGTSPG